MHYWMTILKTFFLLFTHDSVPHKKNRQFKRKKQHWWSRNLMPFGVDFNTVLLYLNWECRIFMPCVFIAWEQFRYETTLFWKKSAICQNEGIWGLGILAGCTVSSNLNAKFPFANLSKQECRQLEQDEIVILPKGTCWSGRVRHEFESKASVTTLTLLHAVRAGPRLGRFNP